MAERTSISARIRGLFTHAPRFRTVNAIVIVVAAALSLMLLLTADHATATNMSLRTATTEYLACSEAATSLKDASDFLTLSARLFSVTHDPQHVGDYYEEINVTKRRDQALDVLRDNIEDGEASRLLSSALQESNSLAGREGHAMRMVAEACDYALEGDLLPLAAYELTASERLLSPDEQLALAQDLLFGTEYRAQKALIDSMVEQCTSQLIDQTHVAQEESSQQLQSLLSRQRLLTALLLVVVVLTILLVIFLILWPLASYSALISDGLPLAPSGSRELRELAEEYNDMYEKNRRSNDRLRHRADHDALTDLFNRGAYDDLLQTYKTNVALMLVDVDYFKDVNDTYGHEVGDDILRKVAQALKQAFRTSDFACRIGGDEFAVIITDMNPQLKNVLVAKITQIAGSMRATNDGLPSTTLSIGVAFSDLLTESETLFNAADRALYVVKARGRNGYAFADETDLSTPGV